MASQPERTVVTKGQRLSVVYGEDDDGCRPAQEFLETLAPSDRAKLLVLFDRIAEHGLIQDGGKFKQLQGDIWEFKARGRDTGLRVTCYRTGLCIVLLTGFKKKEDEAPRSEIKRAERVCRADKNKFERGEMRGRR